MGLNKKEYQTLIEINGKLQPGFKNAIKNVKLGMQNAALYAKQAEKRTRSFGSCLAGPAIVAGIAVAANAMKDFLGDSIAAGKEQLDAERKLSVLLRNNKAVRAQGPEAYKKGTIALSQQASQMQKTGVVADEVTIAGQAQLANFGLQVGQIQKLTVGMDDMLVKQNGLNATQEDAVHVATLIGKGIKGQVGALKRAGIFLDKNQEKIMKSGTETQRVAMITKFLETKYKGMNAEYAKSDEGKVQIFANLFNDMQENLGMKLLPQLAKLAAFGTAQLPAITAILNGTVDVLVKTSDTVMNIANFFTQHWTAIAPIVTGIATAFGVYKLGLIIMNTWDWITTAGAIALGAALEAVKWKLLAGAGIMGIVVAAGIALYMNWDTIKAKAIEVWTMVVSKLQEAWAKMKPIFEMIANAMKTAFNFTPIGMAINAGKAIAGAVQKHNASKPVAKNAMGSASFKGGPTWVGENGPEIINAPRGSNILSNSRSRNMLGGGGGVSVSIVIQGNADENKIQQAANSAFKDFERKYNALMARQNRLGYAT